MSDAIEAERRQAFRAMLRHPLLPAADETADEYILVRRHSPWLKDWLTKFPAWSLHIDKDVARLRKPPADHLDETRPAVDRTSGTSFSRRRYALLCLVLAALEKSEGKTTLAQIAQTVEEFGFEVGNYDQRRDLVHAVRLLMDIGGLCKLEGDEREFLNRSGTHGMADVLYDVNRPILASILNVSSSPSAIEATQRNIGSSLADRVGRLIDDPIPEAEEPRSQWIRARLVRTLLDDPILYFDDLNDEERIYLEQHRAYLLRQIYEATGLLAEVRREGIALVDDEGSLTDIHLPEESVDGHLSLQLVQWLAQRCRQSPGVVIPVSEVEEHFRLTEDTLLRLRGLRLIRLTADGVVPLAACGRYAMEE